MGVSLLNFFDLKPLNTSKQALNTNPPFFWDTLYVTIWQFEKERIHERAMPVQAGMEIFYESRADRELARQF